MNKPVALALLIGGIVLLVFGYNASQSFNSSVLRVFTGSPSNRAVWMITAGAVATLLGIIGLTRGPKA